MTSHTKVEWSDAVWCPTPNFGTCEPEEILDKILMEPLSWKEPRRVRVKPLPDLFLSIIPDDFIARVFAVMERAPQHTYQILTWHPRRMRSLLSSQDFTTLVDDHRVRVDPGCGDFFWPLPNCWLGVSVKNQQRADLRIPALLETPAAVRFLTCDPLLGPIEIPFFEKVGTCTCAGGGDWPHESNCGLTPGPAWDNLHWVSVSGESGVGARPMRLEWARSLRDQCANANVPFFFKQLGTVTARELDVPGTGDDLDLIPADLRIRDFPRPTEESR